ncbi:MAG TPA: hypothetical protein VLA19_15030, partial [Herpetosiphonaceae bacterium]|nr:hypothetical protein [Herpetosiphonaceae bacterium]
AVSGMMEGHSGPTTGFGWHIHRRDRGKRPQVEGLLCLHVILSDRLLAAHEVGLHHTNQSRLTIVQVSEANDLNDGHVDSVRQIRSVHHADNDIRESRRMV